MNKFIKRVVFVLFGFIALIFFWMGWFKISHNINARSLNELSLNGKYSIATIIKITRGKGSYAYYSYKVSNNTFYGKTWIDNEINVAVDQKFLLIYSKINPNLSVIIFDKPLLEEYYSNNLDTLYFNKNLIDSEHISTDWWIFR